MIWTLRFLNWPAHSPNLTTCCCPVTKVEMSGTVPTLPSHMSSCCVQGRVYLLSLEWILRHLVAISGRTSVRRKILAQVSNMANRGHVPAGVSSLFNISSERAVIAESLWRLAKGWMVRGSNSGGGEIFRTCSDWPWGPPGLLYNGYRVSFPGVKQPGCGVALTTHPI